MCGDHVSPSVTKQCDFQERRCAGFFNEDLSGKLEFHGNVLSHSDTTVELGEIWCRPASTAVERFVSFVKIGALIAALSGRN
jgi:hypothetical protein